MAWLRYDIGIRTDAALLQVQHLMQQGEWKAAEDAVGSAALPATEAAWGESAPAVALPLLLTAEVWAVIVWRCCLCSVGFMYGIMCGAFIYNAVQRSCVALSSTMQCSVHVWRFHVQCSAALMCGAFRVMPLSRHALPPMPSTPVLVVPHAHLVCYGTPNAPTLLSTPPSIACVADRLIPPSYIPTFPLYLQVYRRAGRVVLAEGLYRECLGLCGLPKDAGKVPDDLSSLVPRTHASVPGMAAWRLAQVLRALPNRATEVERFAHLARWLGCARLGSVDAFVGADKDKGVFPVLMGLRAWTTGTTGAV